MHSKTKFFHNLAGVILLSLLLAFFAITVVFFALGIKTASIDAETGKTTYVESYILTFAVFGFFLTPAMLLTFIIYLIVFEINKKNYRLSQSQDGTSSTATVDVSAKGVPQVAGTNDRPTKESGLLNSYIDKEPIRPITIIKMYLFGSKGPMIFIGVMMLLFIGLSFTGDPVGDSMSMFSFYFCLSMSVICLLFLIFVFTLFPYLTAKKNSKNNEGNEIRIYDDRIELESCTDADKNNTVKQAIIVLYFDTAKNAKESNDCFFFITGSKPRVTFYIGKSKAMGEEVEDFLSRKTKEIRAR